LVIRNFHDRGLSKQLIMSGYINCNRSRFQVQGSGFYKTLYPRRFLLSGTITKVECPKNPLQYCRDSRPFSTLNPEPVNGYHKIFNSLANFISAS
jgi:hypothetical protein